MVYQMHSRQRRSSGLGVLLYFCEGWKRCSNEETEQIQILCEKMSGKQSDLANMVCKDDDVTLMKQEAQCLSLLLRKERKKNTV